jgi:16S rRNA (guanine527-N7)-methyltransferase
MDRDRLRQVCIGWDLNLSEAQLDQFDSFERALYETNAHTNLTRVAPDECWLRHFADSLAIAKWIPENAKVLDLGTGPGFPAWPIACARPDLQVTALDSAGKMIRFLQSQPLPNLKAVQGRAEDRLMLGKFDLVTGRAVAPLAIQLELSAFYCKLGGTINPMRTVNEIDEFDHPAAKTLGLKFQGHECVAIPETDIVRAFPIFEKTKETPPKYPRQWAEIRRQPLGATSR